MSEIINTGNKIGQSIAMMRMMIGFTVASCMCSCGGMVLKNKNDKKENLKTASFIFLCACSVMLISYLSYSVTKSSQGMGSMVALNAGLSAASLLR